MTPDFALTLSFEGIALLHRGRRGWLVVGETPLDAPDLSAELDRLRSNAKALSKRGFATKIVLPEDQVRYITLETGNVSESERDAAARAALDGATPYALDELSITWAADGRLTHVAAVAHETLAEAEEFAKTHRFNPVCFVSSPAEGSYVGEPFFGITSALRARDSAAQVQADKTPVRIIGHQKLPEAAPNPPAGPKDLPDRAADTPETAARDDTLVLSDASESAPPSKVPPPETPSGKTSSDTPKSKMRRKPAAPAGAGQAPAATAAKAPEPDADRGAASVKDDAEDAADSKPLPAFSSSRRRRTDGSAPALAGATPVAADTTPSAPPARHITFTDVEPDTAEVGALFANKDIPAPPPAKEPRFDGLGNRTAATTDSSNRRLALIITVVVLVLLAAIAVWATVFNNSGILGLFRRDAPAEIVTSPAPAPPPDAVLDARLADDPLATVAPATGDSTIVDSTEVEMAEEAATGPATPEEAEALYAATGIWQRAPDAPPVQNSEDLDGVYISHPEDAVIGQDAVALPGLDAALTDLLPRRYSSPAPAGTEFTFDGRGFVTATPDGAVTPEGITVYAGRPPARPGAFPERAAEPAPAVDVPAGPPQLRPRARPQDIALRYERIFNGGLTRGELAGRRPKARPASAKAVDEVDETPTEQAIAVSLKPKTRPQGFAARLEAARNDPANAPEIRVAAAAPVAAGPRLPTTASVARQATVRNALNLRKVNLIGVYGKPSDRKALIRLASGRYVKVGIGDRIDGGRVAAISETELRYVKGGRNVVLRMPRG